METQTVVVFSAVVWATFHYIVALKAGIVAERNNLIVEPITKIGSVRTFGVVRVEWRLLFGKLFFRKEPRFFEHTEIKRLQLIFRLMYLGYIPMLYIISTLP